MSKIEICGLHFAYPGSADAVFENVSLRWDTDWRLGLIGRNGRGKTTLMRLLCGAYDYRGHIAAGQTCVYFPFPVDRPARTTREIVRQSAPDAADWQFEREMRLLEVDADALDRPFATLSNGEQIKTLLAALFTREDAYLLIDEPTNHLDQAGRALLARYLQRKQGFLLASHDRAFLDGCADHILSINKTGFDVRQGGFSSWYAEKQARDAAEYAQNARLARDIDRLQDAARRASDWSGKAEKDKHARNSGLRPDRGYAGHKAAKLMKRAKTIETRREQAAAQKRTLLRDVEYAEALKLSPLSYHSERLLAFDQVSVRYDGRAVCAPVTLVVRRGDRIALTGRNGAGKTSLLRLALDEAVPHTGAVQRGSGLRISYVSQETTLLRGGLVDYAARAAIDRTLFFAILRKLDLSRAQLEKDMAQFSSGQKKKVLLARSLCEQAHLYVWDEPLNFIDLFSRMQIERLLDEYRPTMLLVEHDAAFVQAVATQVVTLEQPQARQTKTEVR